MGTVSSWVWHYRTRWSQKRRIFFHTIVRTVPAKTIFFLNLAFSYTSKQTWSYICVQLVLCLSLPDEFEIKIELEVCLLIGVQWDPQGIVVKRFKRSLKAKQSVAWSAESCCLCLFCWMITVCFTIKTVFVYLGSARETVLAPQKNLPLRILKSNLLTCVVFSSRLNIKKRYVSHLQCSSCFML